MMSRRTIGIAATTAGLLMGVTLSMMLAAAPTPGNQAPGNHAPTQDAPPRGGPGGMPDLIGGLKTTEGCLGVDAGRMQSGKQSIFAWFEDKKAVKRWYASEVHQGVMDSVAGGMAPDHAPLEYIADDEGPILVIATLTMSDKPHFESMPNFPISQISIELFKPLPGGAFLGARLSPESFKVEHMHDYTPASAADGS